VHSSYDSTRERSPFFIPAMKRRVRSRVVPDVGRSGAHPPRPRRATDALATLALVVVAIAVGCAGSEQPVGEAVVVGTVAAGGKSRDPYAAFADCIRKQGLASVDLLPGGGVKISGPDQRLHAATRACAFLLPAAHNDVTPAEAARFRAEMLAFTRCIRAHGLELPDPTFVPLPGGFDVAYPHRRGEPPPQSDPGWKRARAECQHLNPLLRRHG
jgi:hypothetical protein